MHHPLEIIMPPVHNIEAAIKQIMTPFDEQTTPKDDDWLVVEVDYHS